jgi:hypothetical protein
MIIADRPRACKRRDRRAAATIHAGRAGPFLPGHGGFGEAVGRGERIRTSGLYVPNVALYQAKLHPDSGGRIGRHFGAAAVLSATIVS